MSSALTLGRQPARNRAGETPCVRRYSSGQARAARALAHQLNSTFADNQAADDRDGGEDFARYLRDGGVL